MSVRWEGLDVYKYPPNHIQMPHLQANSSIVGVSRRLDYVAILQHPGAHHTLTLSGLECILGINLPPSTGERALLFFDALAL
jgi:hypothetical protein